MSPLRVAVAGAAGRMGRELIRAILVAPERFALAGATERPGSEAIGLDAAAAAGLAPIGVALSADPAQAAAGADAWVDFTSPKAFLAAERALPEGLAAILGATGFDAADEAALQAAARRRAIVRSGNFSLGIAVLARLARLAAAALGPDWDIEILETHHRRKRDAPSGTALMLGEAAAAGRGASLAAVRLAPYEALIGEPRPHGGIGFAVRRGGGVIGAHEAAFISEREVVRLSHDAMDRGVFADGALAAARWAIGRAAGLYSMDDVLDP